MVLIKAGVWHTTVWVSGIWQEDLWLEYGVLVPPTAPPTVPRGFVGRRLAKNLLITIDGQVLLDFNSFLMTVDGQVFLNLNGVYVSLDKQVLINLNKNKPVYMIIN